MKKSLLQQVFGVASSAAVLSIPVASAADVTWDNAGTGSFTVGTNWSTDVVPGNTDNAIIGNGGTATVASPDAIEVLQLRVDSGTVNQTGGSLTATFNPPPPVPPANNDGVLRAINVGSASGQTGTYNASGTSTLGGGAVRIGFNGGTGVMNLSGSASYSSVADRDTWLGNGVGSDGTLTLSDGATWNSTSAVVVGRAGGTGELTLSGTSQVNQSGNNTFLGDGAGTTSTVTLSGSSKIRNTSGEIFIGNTGAHTTMTIEDDAEVEATNNWIAIGRFGNGTSNGDLLIRDNGKLRKTGGGGHVVIGADAVGSVTMQDNAVLSSNGDLLVGEGDDADATLDVQGGTVTVGGWTKIGAGGGSIGAASISGTSVVNTTGTFIVGDNGEGSLTMSGGTVTTTGETWVGQSGSGVGVFTLSNGTYTSGAWIAVGRDGAQGTLNVSGGTLSHTGAGVVNGENLEGSNFVVNGSAGEVAVVNHTGGTINNTTSILAIGENGTNVSTWTASAGTANLGQLRVGFKGNGTLTIGGAATYNATKVYLSSNSGSTGHLNLNSGGVLAADFIEEGAGTGTASFNGGTLKARLDGADFLADFEDGDLVILAGGLTINTDGNDVFASSSLVGVGGFTKVGAGELDFQSLNMAYLGDTVVEGGTLTINTTFLADMSDVYLTAGSVFNLNFDATDAIRMLFIDGDMMAIGTWGGIGSGADYETALITGDGLLLVTVPEPAHYAMGMVLLLGLAIVARRRRCHA